MSKTVLAVALVVAAVAVPFLAPAAAAAIFGTATALGIAAVTATLEIGLALTQSALLGPSVPKALGTNPIERLYASLDTTAPRKIVFGNTAAATDVRYQTYTGTNQENYHQVIALASHEVESIYEEWFDNELAWNLASGTDGVGRYAGYLTNGRRELGATGDYFSIDGTWGAGCTLTGCAYLRNQYLLTGPDESTPSPFQSGVSSRITIRTKGALTYDPRLDSTVEGGSGAHLAGTQTTWAWDDDGSCNPALQLLWYMLGWRESVSGKLMVGMGLPPARIDLPSFITAANVCDESVALKGGGSEPRYRSAGVLSEGDARSAVMETLCATMNATLRDAGGKISLTVLQDDLATPALAFGIEDIIGDEEWRQTPPISEYRNIVRGRCVDPSDNALYQLTDYPEQSLTAPDGIDRIETVDYPMVQSHTQAQRLAKLRLMRGQFQGRYIATFGPRAWAVSLGDIVAMTHPALAWDEKLFRVVDQSVGLGGTVKLTLLEEDASIYAWDETTDELAGITAGTPFVYDPSLNPLVSSPSTLTLLIKTSYCTAAITMHDNNTFDVSAHTRVYDDKSVSVSAATGVAFTGTAGQILGIYYDDAPRAGGAVTYHGIASATAVSSDCFASTTHPSRHFVGYGTVLAGGAGSADGTGTTGGTGYGGSGRGIIP